MKEKDTSRDLTELNMKATTPNHGVLHRDGECAGLYSMLLSTLPLII